MPFDHEKLDVYAVAMDFLVALAKKLQNDR